MCFTVQLSMRTWSIITLAEWQIKSLDNTIIDYYIVMLDTLYRYIW